MSLLCVNAKWQLPASLRSSLIWLLQQIVLGLPRRLSNRWLALGAYPMHYVFVTSACDNCRSEPSPVRRKDPCIGYATTINASRRLRRGLQYQVLWHSSDIIFPLMPSWSSALVGAFTWKYEFIQTSSSAIVSIYTRSCYKLLSTSEGRHNKQEPYIS